jgi:alpha-mannosidase
MTTDIVNDALRRLRDAADLANAGWLPSDWQRVEGPGPDRYDMKRTNVLGPLGMFDEPLALEAGGRIVVDCALDVPARIAGVDTAGDPLLLTVWSIFPIGLQHLAHDGASRFLLDEEIPPAASGPVLLTVVPELAEGHNGRLRADVRTFDTQVYKQWNWFSFTTPGLQARFEVLDVAWAQLFLADALGATDAERKAVDAAARLVPEELVEVEGGPLAAALDEMAAALSPVAAKVAALSVHLVGHSHIDMNWLWTWPDTVEVIKRDFRSVLSMMDDYPEMRFTHSQPATYVVIRDEEPALFEKVLGHIASGRWEPATMQWVEGDTNMASSEATARHALEGVSFAREELHTEPHVFLAPDTFGHAGNLPQVTAGAGTRVYYHHRCNPGHATGTIWPAYWWEGQDGTRLLAVSTPTYNGHITAGDLAKTVISLGTEHGLTSALYFYGVGDHGGGPTRESLDVLRRLQKQPLLPRAECSTLQAYAADVVASGAPLPVHRGESSTTFEGCYTTHADTKRFNREGENLLQTADALTALAGVDERSTLDVAWRTVLFNQFHDIFDGSAIAEVYRDQAVDHAAVVEAAGAATDAALAVLHDGLPAGCVAVTNPHAWACAEPVLVTATGDGPLAAVADDGEVLSTQATAGGVWFVPEVPGFSTRTFRFEAAEAAPADLVVRDFEAGKRRWIDVETPLLRARVRTESGIITSLVDRRTGRQLVPRGLVDFRPELALGVLQLQDERHHDMSSWDIREVHTEQSLLTGAVTTVVEKGPLRVVLEVVHTVRSSTITERITFHRDLARVDFDVDVDWQEPGDKEVGVPDLKVSFNTTTRRPQAWFETPFGAVERAPDGMEVPALRWAAIVGEEGGIAVVNTDKHGYDALGTRLRLTLVRTAYDPDAASDIGRHHTSFSLLPVAGDWRGARLTQLAAGRNQPLVAREVGAPAGATSLLGPWQPTVTDGPVVASALKLARRGSGRVLRLYESTGVAASTEIAGIPAGAEVWEVSIVEDRLRRLPVDAGRLHLAFTPWQVRTLLVD